MAIQKVNETVFSRGLIESMKQQGNEIARPEAEKANALKPTSKLQSFKEAAKGFKIDTKA